MGIYRSDKETDDNELSDSETSSDEVLEPKDRPTDQPLHETTTVNHRYTAISSLLTHIEGYSWIVVFYHQLLDEDDEPRELDTSIDPVDQQYQRIQDFELKVTDPLSFRYEKARRTDTYEGEGVIYPGTVEPHVYDHFIGDIGDGRTGIFTITDIEPMSIYTQRCYRIRYNLLDQSSDELLEDISDKVVSRYHFVKNFMRYGRNPLIEEQDFIRARYLKDHTEKLFEYYLTRFVDKARRFLLRPGTGQLTFDPFIAHALQRMRNVTDYKRMRQANWPRIEEIDEDATLTVWDLLLSNHPRPQWLRTGGLEQKMILVDTQVIRRAPFLPNLYYSHIQRIVWPSSKSISTWTGDYYDSYPYPYWNAYQTYQAGDIVRYVDSDGQMGYYALQAEYVEIGHTNPEDDDNWTYLGESASDVQTNALSAAKPQSDEREDYHPIDDDDYYVFSEHFYKEESEEQSLIEYLASQKLQRKSIETLSILELIEAAYDWPELEQFYYIPVLVTLSDYALAEGYYTGGIGEV